MKDSLMDCNMYILSFNIKAFFQGKKLCTSLALTAQIHLVNSNTKRRLLQNRGPLLWITGREKIEGGKYLMTRTCRNFNINYHQPNINP
jgi:hypothetical protein